MNRYIRNILSLLMNTLVVAILIYVMKEYLVGSDIHQARGVEHALKFYTTDSNLIYAICCLITIPFNLLCLFKEGYKMPKWVSIMRLMGTTLVCVTFFVVIFILGPFNPNGGYKPLFEGLPYYLHLTVPVIGMVSFIAFDLYNEIDFKYLWYNTIPTLIYGVFYIIWVKGYGKDDHYMFFKFGIGAFIGIFIGIFTICFGSGALLRYLNNLRNVPRIKKNR